MLMQEVTLPILFVMAKSRKITVCATEREEKAAFCVVLVKKKETIRKTAGVVRHGNIVRFDESAVLKNLVVLFKAFRKAQVDICIVDMGRNLQYAYDLGFPKLMDIFADSSSRGIMENPQLMAGETKTTAETKLGTLRGRLRRKHFYR